MKTRVVIALTIVLFLVITGSVVVARIVLRPQQNIQEGLSPRGEEFIEHRIASGDEFWKAVDTGKHPVPEVSDVKTACFSVTVDFPVTNIVMEEQEDHCTVRAQVIKPRARFVLSVSSMPPKTLEEDSGVMLREGDKETYVRKPIDPYSFEDVRQYVSEDTVVTYLWSPDRIVTVSLSNLGFSPKDDPANDIFQHIMTTVESLRISPEQEPVL